MPIGFNDFVIFSAGGILGYLGRQLLEHKLAIIRNFENIKITEFNKASANFRAAFAPSLAMIHLAKNHGSTHEVPDVDAYLKKTLPDIAAAVEIFRPYVHKKNRDDYQRAWEEYRHKVWNYGFDATSLRKDIEDPHEIYENYIKEILKHSESIK